MSFSRQVQLIFIGWISFLAVINLLDRLPHLQMHFLSWINFSLFFLLALTSFFIARQDNYFRDVFLHYGGSFLAISLTFAPYFIGIDYLIGDNVDFYYALIYSRFAVWNVLLIGILLVAFRYAFLHVPRWLCYLLAWVIGLAVEADLWYQAITVTRFPFKLGLLATVIHFIRMDVVALLALGLYFYIFIRQNRPNGAFIHAWALGMTLLYVSDIFDLVVGFWRIEVYGIDQYFNLFVMIVLAGVLFLRLTALSSESYQLREQLIFDNRFTISTPVIQRNHSGSVIMNQLKELFSSQSIVLQLIFAIGLLLLSALSQKRVVLFKIFVLIVLLAAIFNIYSRLLAIRTHKNQILNQKFIKTKTSP
jgi:hypothetical protein